jgi:hypothetical protein
VQGFAFPADAASASCQGDRLNIQWKKIEEANLKPLLWTMFRIPDILVRSRILLFSLFCLLLFEGTLTSFFKDINFSDYFCLMLEGSGSVPLTNGSGIGGQTQENAINEAYSWSVFVDQKLNSPGFDLIRLTKKTEIGTMLFKI